MRFARWLDHLPPWLAYGAIANTGIYERWELLLMAMPLLIAALIQVMRWDLSRWRLGLELLTLVILFVDLAIRRSFISAAIHLLFMLAGVRLMLPRQLPQRRQLLLIGFLLFLTTAISTSDLAFLGWTTLWLLGSALVLLHQSWEPSASLRRGPTIAPPFRKAFAWALATLLISAGVFALLPRVSLGLRPLPAFGSALAGAQAGLSDRIELGGVGPIAANSEVVMRIEPPAGASPAQIDAWAKSLSLLRGVVLENVRGQRWEVANLTPKNYVLEIGPQDTATANAEETRLDCLLSPSPQGILPLPYNTSAIISPFNRSLLKSSGQSIRWPYPPATNTKIGLFWRPRDEISYADWQPRGHRQAMLTFLGPEHEAARREGFRVAPNPLPAAELAERFTRHLRAFRYTLDNPSGKSANPLEDFLERSKAGHCEYFASSLALMLRARGVPARVVNGYRLGPWFPEGGYFRVTQDEAHSWTEYYDESIHRWRVADPTPPAPRIDKNPLLASWERWTDALRYRWDRHVVRFSDEDQQAGFGWVQGRIQSWNSTWKPSPASLMAILGLPLLIWFLSRMRSFWMPWLRSTPTDKQGIRALRPLIRRTRKIASPETGETARAWLFRLAELRSERRSALYAIAEQVDASVYGNGDESHLRTLIRAEMKAWKG
jgi:protein-glutamine gamma-glutamyltransferase